MKKLSWVSRAGISLTLAASALPWQAVAVGAAHDAPLGLLDHASTTVQVSTVGSGETQLPFLLGTVNPTEAAVYRVTLSVRLQASIAGCTGDIYLRRTDADGTTTIGGGSIYLAQAGGAGASLLTINAFVDMAPPFPGPNSLWTAHVKRTAGSCVITTGQTAGTSQQMAVEEIS